MLMTVVWLVTVDHVGFQGLCCSRVMLIWVASTDTWKHREALRHRPLPRAMIKSVGVGTVLVSMAPGATVGSGDVQDLASHLGPLQCQGPYCPVENMSKPALRV